MIISRQIFLSLFFFFLFLLPAAPLWSASSEKELFVVAQRAFEDGFYDVSLRYIQQLFEEFPGTQRYVEARLMEGQSYFFKQQYLKAYNIFKDLVQKDSYRDASLFWLGEACLKGNEHERAKESYLRLIAEYPTSIFAPQAHYSLAWSFFEQQDYVTAKKYFQTLVERFPSNPLTEDSFFKTGECDYNAGFYEGAAHKFKEYLKAYPVSSRLFEATFNVAEAYYYLDQYQYALEYYTKAQGLADNGRRALDAITGRGWSLTKLGRFDEALKTHEEALLLAVKEQLPTDSVLISKATLLFSKGDHNGAIAEYSRILTDNPQGPRSAEVYLGRANAWYFLNKYPEAIADYNRVLSAVAPDVSLVEKARFGLAWTYLKAGAPDLSIENFRIVLDSTPDKMVKVSALTQIGDAYQESGRPELAIDAYDRILKDMPDTPYTDYVQYRLGVALLKAGRIDAAIMAFQSFSVNFPKSRYLAESRYFLGVAYFRKKDWKSSLQILENFLKTSSAVQDFHAEAKYVMGQSSFMLRQFDKAEIFFKDIVRNYPEQEDLVRNSSLELARCRFEQGQVKEAMAAFNEIIARYPGSEAALEAFLWQGREAMSSASYQSAVDFYSGALEIAATKQQKSGICFELGRAYHAMESLDKALEFYGCVTEDSDVDLLTRARLAAADIFARDLDPAKALGTYTNIVQNSPEFRRNAYIKIAKIYRKEQKYSQEREAYERALQASAGDGTYSNAEIQFLLADSFEVSNENDKAVEAYFKIPYLYEGESAWVVKAYLRIARLFEHAEQWQKAATVYARLLELKVEESKFAQERLQEIAEMNAGARQ